MASPILFPSSTSPGKDSQEGGGRLINAYSETLGPGAASQNLIRRAPGLTLFNATSGTTFRGMWYDGGAYIYYVLDNTLYTVSSIPPELTAATITNGKLTFLSSAVDTSNLTTYTFAAVAIGTAHYNRRIIVSVTFAAADDSPATMTIGGVAATLVKSQGSSVALFIALVPTGTTGNIVVTYNTAATSCSIGVWRLDGVASNTAFSTNGASGVATATGNVTTVVNQGSIVLAAYQVDNFTATWSGSGSYGDALTENFDEAVEGTIRQTGGSTVTASAGTAQTSVAFSGAATWSAAIAAWQSNASASDAVTFAKNNKAPTPDQVLVTPSLGAFTFLPGSAAVLDVNSEIPNSVTFGEGYFFFTTPGGLVYASNLNSTTVTSTDVMRIESKSESLIRGIFFNGELYLFSATHIEVRASGGTPNATGFPLNRTTVIWRGLVGIFAVTGWEDGFHANLTWVADDDSVRMLVGYNPQQISTPDLERAIHAVTDKTTIRAWCYDVDGHASIVIDLGTATWTYDLNETKWHERKSDTLDYWRATGNSVKAFDKWIVGDHLSGNLYQVDPTAYDEVDGITLSFEVESIEMEAFPQRLGIPRADFNFVTGVGDTTTRDPDVLISWSDDGGHTWSDPVTRKLGEAGRYFEQIRLNRVGLTGRKGRRWRLRVDDPVYVGLLGGSMEVAGRP